MFYLEQGGLGKGEDNPGPGLFQDVLDMVPAGDRVQGDRHRARQQRPEIAHGPFRAVFQEDGHPLPFFHPLGLKPLGHGQAEPIEPAVGVLPHLLPFPEENAHLPGSFPGRPGQDAGQGLGGVIHSFLVAQAFQPVPVGCALRTKIADNAHPTY